MTDETPSLGSVFDEAYAEASEGQESSGAPTPPEPGPGAQPDPGQPGQGAQPEPPQRSTLDYLASRGIDVSEYSSDDQWFQAVEEFEAQRRAHSAEISDWHRERDQFREWKQQQQQQQPEQSGEPEAPSWQPPTVSETAKSLYSVGQLETDPSSGMLKAKDPYMQRYADEFNNFVQWKREKADLIFTNPEKFYEETGLLKRLEGLKPEFDKDALLAEAEERVLQNLQQAQQSHTVQSQFEEAFPTLYQVDQAGKPVLNAEGNWIPTERGQSFEDAMAAIQAEGVTDKAAQVRLALKMIGNQAQQQPGQPQPGQQPQAPPPTKEQVREQNQETWLQRSVNGKNRLPPDEARINETVKKADPGDDKYKTLTDVWDEAYRETLGEMS